MGVSNVGTPVQGDISPGEEPGQRAEQMGNPDWLIKVTVGVRPRGRDREREGEETGEGWVKPRAGGPLTERGRQG